MKGCSLTKIIRLTDVIQNKIKYLYTFIINFIRNFAEGNDKQKTHQLKKMKKTAENILDVTVLEPSKKHPTIFAWFDELAGGECFIIHNDHDPKPLYYQMYGERGGVFNWEYLEQGPKWWKVRITKRRHDETQQTIGQMVAQDARKAEIFRKYNIAYGSDGKKILNEAAKERGLDVTKIEQELQQLDRSKYAEAAKYNELDLDFLIDYIIQTHHGHVRRQIPTIREYASKVMVKHAAGHPELNKIYKLVEELYTEISTNIQKEELILFPYIKEMVAAARNNIPFAQSPFGSVQQPVNMMEMEHEAACSLLKEIRRLSLNYTLPEDSCESYHHLYDLLDGFEHDLQQHTHLENNILFPKTVKIEKQLTSKQAV